MQIHRRALMVSIVGAACFGTAGSARAEAGTGQAAPACSEENPGDAPPRSAPGAMSDGFSRWLSQQCPDGVLVVARDTTTGELAGTGTCEELRETALADEPVRAELIDAYLARTAAPAVPPGDERAGEAKEPLLFGLILCGILSGVASSATYYACDRRFPGDWARCTAGSGGIGLAASVFCGLAVPF